MQSLLPGDFQFLVSELQAALQETKYRGIEPEKLVEKYFNEKLLSNSRKREEQAASDRLFREQRPAS